MRSPRVRRASALVVICATVSIARSPACATLAAGARSALARPLARRTGARAARVLASTAEEARPGTELRGVRPARDLNSYIMREGPPSFFTPPSATTPGALHGAAYGAPSEGGGGPRPAIVYCPGIELSGYTISKQLARLEPSYDVRILRVAPTDRTPAPELATLVAAEVRKLAAEGRKVVLLGESFGGVLALDTALTLADGGAESGLACLVLINPATVIGRTPWPTLAAALEGLPETVYDVLPAFLTPLLANPLRLLDFRADGGAGSGGAGGGTGSGAAAATTDAQAQAGAPQLHATDAAAAHAPLVAAHAGEAAAVPANSSDAPPPAAAAAAAAAAASGGWAQAQAAEVGARLAEMLPSLAQLPRALPRKTLAFRLRQLGAYAALVDARDWSAARVPALLLASTADNVLPAPQAARLIAARLLGARVRLLQGAGHAPLFEPATDLSAILAEEGVLALPTPRPRDYVSQFVRPTAEQLAGARAALRPLRRLVSPRFFSTLPSGARVPGLLALPAAGALSGLPPRPILFVGNHQLFGLTDLPLLVEELLTQKGILARGLAHPVAFQGGAKGGARAAAGARAARAGGDAGGAAAGAARGAGGAQREQGGGGGGAAAGGVGGLFDLAQFGAVPVSARNCLRLLQRGEAALLYPGGIREAFKRRGENYQLFWPDGATQADFVRLAARAGALIIPVAAVGADDSFELLADTDEMLRLPAGLGEALRRAAEGLPQGRSGEQFVGPIALPQLPPNRYYFCFGKPFDAALVDAQDARASTELYREVRAELEGCMAWLLCKREEDPYSGFAPRLLYEAAADWKRQAPTFRL